jgi:hypothetical protein
MSKTTVEDCRSVSIAFLKKHGYFCGYRSGRINWTNAMGEQVGSIEVAVNIENRNYVRFSYTITNRYSGEKVDYDYEVGLTTTQCHFGGVRYWFICPLNKNSVPCRRRVGKLYRAGKYFGCRHCYDLSYKSRNESHSGRFGIMGSLLDINKRINKLCEQTKYWTYAGRPTRKARRIYTLQKKREACGRILQTIGF